MADSVIEVIQEGAQGVGVPAGGLTGQVLAKTSDESYMTRWVTVSTTGTQTIFREYTFTQTTATEWTVTNAGSTLADFNDPKIEFFYNGVKLRKGSEVTWTSETKVSLTVPSIQYEDYLIIRTTSLPDSSTENPIEVTFTKTAAPSSNWTVTNAGTDLTEFNSARRQFFLNGIKLRKSAQVTWVSDTEVTINYDSEGTEDYLVIRVDV